MKNDPHSSDVILGKTWRVDGAHTEISHKDFGQVPSVFVCWLLNRK